MKDKYKKAIIGCWISATISTSTNTVRYNNEIYTKS
jgi:hypothetical protein